MAHRRGSLRGRGVSESQRRKKAWFGVKIATGATGIGFATFTSAAVMETAATGAGQGAFTQDILASVDFGTLATGDAVSTLPEECTILRSRGSLQFPKNSTQTGLAPLIGDNYAWGFGITDIRSIVEGVVPLPISDVDWDGWMFLRQSASPPLDAEGTIVDVKAMRKIKTGDALFFVAQAVNGGTIATPIGQWIFDMRLLILLP